MRRRCAPCVALLCLVWGCADHAATQVLVQLHAEPGLASRAASLQIVVEDNEQSTVLDTTKALDGAAARIARIPLIPKDDDPTRRFSVRAELRDEAGTSLATLQAESGYREHELRVLNLWFWDACQGVECGEGRTCHDGVCRGSCFETSGADSSQPSRPSCGECQRCAGRCQDADGASCGCPGESCLGSRCVPKTPVQFVAAGSVHSCATVESGDVYCWGSDTSETGGGRLGLGSSAGDSAVPVRVSGANGAVGLAASANSTCAVASDARYCWGHNFVGELGTAANAVEPAPVRIDDPFQLSALSSGFRHSCGVSQDGGVWCWGYNERGNLGVGTTTTSELPAEVGRGYAGVSAGGDHVCAVRIDRQLECWGYNDSLELGVPGEAVISTPVRPGCEPANSGDRCFSDWTAVGVGAFHSCAIRASGELYCWGGNLNGQLGIGPVGSTKDQAEPQRVAGNVRWATVAGGARHTCALDLNGALYCWGMNEDRQLGIPGADFVSLPTRVDTDAPDGWRALRLGERHSCAIRADRTLWCWGLNSSGQVGIGSATEAPVERPRRVCF